MKTKETLIKEGFVDCNNFTARDYPEITTNMYVVLWNGTEGKIRRIENNSAGSFFELENGYSAHRMDIMFYKILNTTSCPHCGYEKENKLGVCIECGKFPPYENPDAILVCEELSNNSRGIAIKWWQNLSSLEKTRICDTNTELVGYVRRYETLSGSEIEKLYNEGDIINEGDTYLSMSQNKRVPKKQYTEFNKELFSKYIAKFNDHDKKKMYNFLKKSLNIWGEK